MLCKKVGGRSHSTHIPKDLEEQVQAWNDEHKRVKQLLKQISELSERIVRSYVQNKRAERRQQSFELAADGRKQHKDRPKGKTQQS